MPTQKWPPMVAMEQGPPANYPGMQGRHLWIILIYS